MIPTGTILGRQVTDATISVHSTQREAVETARAIMKKESAGQLVVHGRDGRITDLFTYGMPPIQNPPGKRSMKIERAVGKITLDRLDMVPLPARD